MTSRVGLLIWIFLVSAVAGGSAVASPVLERRSIYAAADSLHRGLQILGGSADAFALARSLETFAAEGTPGGSLCPALVRVAEDNGLAARYLMGLTSKDLLRPWKTPVIIRVRAALDADLADHYVLIEQIDEGWATVSTSRMKSQKIRTSDLAPLWNGDAVVLAKGQDDLNGFGGGHESGLPMVVGGVLVGVVLFGFSLRWRPALTGSRSVVGIGLQILGLGAVAGVAAMVYATAWAGERVEGARAIAPQASETRIDFRNTSAPLTPLQWVDLSREELEAKVRQGDFTFIDARKQESFDKGHLDDSISLPRYDASTVRLRLAGYEKDHVLVVFCSGLDCGKGRAASTALIRAGFTQVFHYPEGWAELKSWKGLRDGSN